jgi:hypothetical protein
LFELKGDTMNPILREAVAKARASLRPPWKNRPGAWIDADATERAALRRAERYERFAEAPGKRPAGGKARIAIARAEAKRHREAMTGKEFRDFARGFDKPRQFDQADGREAMERDRAKAKAAARRRNDKNNDGWVDGQRPKGAKPKRSVMGETDAFAAKRPSRAAQDAAARAAVQGATAKEVAARTERRTDPTLAHVRTQLGGRGGLLAMSAADRDKNLAALLGVNNKGGTASIIRQARKAGWTDQAIQDQVTRQAQKWARDYALG